MYYSELVVNPAFQYSGDISKGASPDGKVDNRKKSDKFWIVEIKCPFEKRYDMFHQMLLATQTSVLNEWLTGRENYDYYYPIQGQMTISGRIFLAFVVWFCGLYQ